MFLEYILNNDWLMILLFFGVLTPLLMIGGIGLITNPNFIKLNNQQKKYWLIGIFTGLSTSILMGIIYALILLKIGLGAINYFTETGNIIGLLIYDIIIISSIFLLFKYRNSNGIYKHFMYPLDVWKEIFERLDMKMNLGYLEHKGEIE